VRTRRCKNTPCSRRTHRVRKTLFPAVNLSHPQRAGKSSAGRLGRGMLPAIKGPHLSSQRSTSSLDHYSHPKAHPSGQRSTSSLGHHTKAQGWVSLKAKSGVGRRSHSVEPDTEAGAPTRMAHGPSLSQRMAAWRGDDLETDLRSLEQFVQSALTFEDAVRRHNGAQQRRHPAQMQSMAIASSSPSPSPVMSQPRRGELFDRLGRSPRADAGKASEDVFAKRGFLRATDAASGGCCGGAAQAFPSSRRD
jgi:hypothetical protein